METLCAGPVPWGSGVWVGMELDTKEGKNDGSVTYRPFGGKRQVSVCAAAAFIEGRKPEVLMLCLPWRFPDKAVFPV